MEKAGCISMTGRAKSFSGGYRFRNFQGEPQSRLIEAGIPRRVIIPLQQGFGNEVSPVIKTGESVRAGQVIGIDDDSISTPVHSSINGVVDKIGEIEYFYGDTKAVAIKSDGTAGWHNPEYGTSDWTQFSTEKIEDRLYLSGVTSLGRSGIPTNHKSSIISPADVEHVIIHGIGSEVYSSSFAAFLVDDSLKQFIEGLKILRKIMPGAAFHVALNKHRRALIKQIIDLVRDFKWVTVYPLEPRYPQETDEVLIQTLLNKNFPYAYLSANIGIIVLDVQAIIHVYDAVARDKPLIERVIALCGPGFSENLYLKVRVGTSINDVVDNRVKSPGEHRFVINNPLTGEAINDLSLPLDRSFSAIAAIFEENQGEFLCFIKPGFTKDSYTRTFASSFLNFKKTVNSNIHGEERPCIFCGFCEDVCPVGIVPHLVFRHVERDNIDETLLNYRIYNCIGCNLCSYVCPSKIPVSRYIKDGKDKLVQIGLDQSAALPRDIKLLGLEELKGLRR